MEREIMAAMNGRKVAAADKVFGINQLAVNAIKEKGRDKVVQATIGALIDDAGKLIVLSSVEKAFHSLQGPDFARYAPIGGTPEFRAASIQATFGSFRTDRVVRSVAAMGGTGALHLAVANYSEEGENILTTDWCWGPYKQITQELGRGIETFQLFNEEGGFHIESFRGKVRDLLERQNRLIIVLNTPAHNPTGYSLTTEDWENILAFLEEVDPAKRVILIVDAAYIDYAGEEEEVRSFLPILDRAPNTVLPLIACSMSKTFTIYGMRCGALLCMAPDEETADEFVHCCEYSCRAAWSNPVRAGQSLISKIYADKALLQAVARERKEIRDMLLARGRTFQRAAEEAGLVTVPFSAGFFCSIPLDKPEQLAAALRDEDIFLIPLAKGVRVSIASIPEKTCAILPARIKEALDRIGGKQEPPRI